MNSNFDLTPFYRGSIGIDRMFQQLLNHIEYESHNGKYPPYNIKRESDTVTVLEVAVAGFDEGELDITVKDNTLVVNGFKDTTVEDSSYLYQGISSRRFTRSWVLGEHVEVKNATVKNGILSITLEQIIPESARPKTIAITYQKS